MSIVITTFHGTLFCVVSTPVTCVCVCVCVCVKKVKVSQMEMKLRPFMEPVGSFTIYMELCHWTFLTSTN